MVPGFGKQTLTIGSDPSCDIVLQAPGVGSEHGKLVHQGGGRILFINAGTGPSTANGRQLNAGEQVPFDFRTQFRLGEATLPFEHPAITKALFAQGQQQAAAGQLVIGRDPARASLVLQHPSVSSLHCTVALDRMTVVDHGSTSGTYVGGARIAPNQPTPLAPHGIVHVGPVPVHTGVLMEIAQAASRPAAPGGYPPPPVPQGPTFDQHPAMKGGYPPAPGPAVPVPPAHPGTVGLPQAPSIAQPVAPSIAQPQAPGTVAVPRQQPGTQAAPGYGAPQEAPLAGAVKKHKTVFGQLDFAELTKGVKSIGRTEENDIVINHPQVSSKHAQVEVHDGRLFVLDRGSANGTYVRGHRIPPGQQVEIQKGEKIYVGPMPLQMMMSATGAVQVFQEAYGEERWGNRPLYEIEAWSLFLEVPDRDDRSKMKVLLDNIAFKALPGDMIALMGPSGAGKTTLLLALNGYLPPTEGLVRINGEDLYNIYDTLRGSIGYVPQDDLVHPELTVWEAVRYSAKFRLPPDYSEDEIDARVYQTLKDLGLESVAHLQIGSPDAKVLSGGQRKRVNIALELVTDPVILYLDEPTSGLASDDAASLIQLLHDLTRATGKTIIMTIHQPAKDEYEKFTHALILGYGGVPMYFGPTVPDSYNFFNRWAQAQPGGRLTGVDHLPVDNPRDMFGIITAREAPIYEQLKAQNPHAPRALARHQAAYLWRQAYEAEDNPIRQKMYSGRRAVGHQEGQRGVPERRASTRGQFRLLFSRYFKTKWRDRIGTGILFLQAPIIGILLALVFGGMNEEVPAWCLGALNQIGQRTNQKIEGEIFGKLSTTQDHTGAIFFLVISAIWFGTSNAAREIVRERSIYLRERMVNLGLFNYVMSKFMLLTLFCVMQCAMLLGIVFPALGFEGGPAAFAQELSALVATSVCAVATGLILSTLVTSSEAAMALTPIALIPQVVLGGLMVPATTIPRLSAVMYAIPSRWGFEAAIVPERKTLASNPAWLIDLGPTAHTKTSATDFVFDGQFQCATAQMASDTLGGAWSFTTYEDMFVPYAVLGGMTLSLIFAILVILKRRDPV
jgi:ABC-type multidrug transport system ATPase subunit/pSer/pThr/pTyr-binding forkhead associated (FHA) protein